MYYRHTSTFEIHDSFVGCLKNRLQNALKSPYKFYKNNTGYNTFNNNNHIYH